jgi:hypothetical protein
MNKDDIEIIEKKRHYRGHLTVDEFILRHKLFEGGVTNPYRVRLFSAPQPLVSCPTTQSVMSWS